MTDSDMPAAPPVTPWAAEEDRRLEITRVFKAPRAKVYAAWTDPAVFSRWFGPQHTVPVDCAMEARPNGPWHATIAEKGQLLRVSGRFIELRAPERLILTWAWHETADAGANREHETIIIVDLREVEGGTEMRFEQRLFRDQIGRDRHNMGWTSIFEKLDALLAA